MNNIEELMHLSLAELMQQASSPTLAQHQRRVTFSKKVFIPLTQLCRDVCHYCTFAKTPKRIKTPYLPIENVLDIAHAGAAAGCTEALFTLGDKPELRYQVAHDALATMGYASTLDYLYAAAEAVHRQVYGDLDAP